MDASPSETGKGEKASPRVKASIREVRLGGLGLILAAFLVFLVGGWFGKRRPQLGVRKFHTGLERWDWGRFSKASLQDLGQGKYRWRGVGVVSVKPAWQEKAEGLMKEFNPPYAALLVEELGEGRILAAAGSSSEKPFKGRAFQHPLLGRRLVAASIVKTPVAAVLMEHHVANAATMAPCTSIYQTEGGRVVNALGRDRGQQSLAQTLATSCNTVMARYAQKLGWPPILEMFDRVGWLAPVVGLPKTPAGIAPVKAGGLVLSEAASGFGHVEVTPWHMLQLAALLGGEGKTKAPALITWDQPLNKFPGGASLAEACGSPCLQETGAVWSPEIARALLAAHKGTVHEGIGTGHRAFFHNGRYRLPAGVEVFGKTGSLNSPDPRGFLTWFVAVVHRPGQTPLAVTSLVINGPSWRIKASGLMAELLTHMLN